MLRVHILQDSNHFILFYESWISLLFFFPKLVQIHMLPYQGPTERVTYLFLYTVLTDLLLLTTALECLGIQYLTIAALAISWRV